MEAVYQMKWPWIELNDKKEKNIHVTDPNQLVKLRLFWWWLQYQFV